MAKAEEKGTAVMGKENQKFSLQVVARDDWQNPGWTGEHWNKLQVEKVHATGWTVCLSRQGQKLAASKKFWKVVQEVKKTDQKGGAEGRDAGGAGSCGEGYVNSYLQAW